jgi:outer membrane protein assembly factor BamB
MKSTIPMIALIALATACGQKATETSSDASKPKPTLTMKWKTEPVLTTVESVIYDKDRDMIYSSNINGKPDSLDGNGFISKISADGGIPTPYWIKGMDAPKGMGIYKGKLYVADINKIHEIDIDAGKIVKTYPVEGSQFLNDVTIDDSGKVYASDSNTGNIYVLDNGAVSTWLSGVGGPNGLLSEGNNMWVLSWKDQTMNAVDATSKQVTMKADSLENPDGIEAVGDGTYLVSAWNGMIRLVDPASGKVTLLLDTRADSVSAADIDYIPEKRLLLVPTFFKNSVVAYELNK